MKLVIALLLCVILQAKAVSYAQNVTINIENASIADVLEAIQQQTKYDFLFNNLHLKGTKPISLHFKNAPLEKVLEASLANESLTYEIKHNTVLIYKKQAIALTNDNQNTLQQRLISGKVSDAKNQPIPEVTIRVKEKVSIVKTDSQGEYRIAVPKGGLTLIFSAVGYQTQEIAINHQNEISLLLKDEVSDLDEVVVVGYGTRTKRDVTGAISSINEKALKEVPVTSVPQMLQGRVAGAYVTQGSNKPGATPTVRIRGNRSFNAANDPLYVIDGIPVDNALNDINPSDIVSMDVLKDASATAIYGSRGANGVVIITTARGKAGRLDINYNTYFGLTKVNRRADVLNGSEFIRFKRDSYPNLGDDQIFLNDKEKTAVEDSRYIDWQDLIIQNGFTQNHELSMLGGTNSTRYNFSLGYYDDNGYFKGQDFTRYTTRINLDQDIGKRVKAGVSLLGSWSERNGNNFNPYYGVLTNSPLGSPYDENGNIDPYPIDDPTMFNSLAAFQKDKYVNKEKRLRLFGSMFAEAEILKDLKLRVNFGPDLSNGRVGNFNSTQIPIGILPSAGTNEEFTFSYTLENIVSYEKTFAEKHKVDFTGLYSIQERTDESSSISVRNLPVETVSYHNLGSAGEIAGVSSNYSRWDILSYMGRLNYAYDGRFLLTLTGRTDGSSRFAAGHKWGFFPSAVVAYNMTEEHFIKNSSFLDNLKLRVGYGRTGNPGISPYQTQSLLKQRYYDFDGVSAFGYAPSSIPNPDLKWETTGSTNVGLDFGLFRGRINGAVEIYHTVTKDLLLSFLLPRSTGFDNVLSNVGSTQNQGVEISLSTKNIVSDNGFEWSTDITSAYNKEKILELSIGKVDDIGNARFIGKPLSVWYDYKKTGIWQLGEEEQAIEYGSDVGQIKVWDKDGDGQITPEDRTILGSPNPTFTFGFNNRFTYKGIDLSVFVVGALHRMIRSPLHNVGDPDRSNSVAFGGRYNLLDVDYWTPDNPTNAYPQPIGGQGAVPGPIYGSTLAYFDASFIRIRNINFGYTFSQPFVSKIKAKSARLFFNITNPWVYSPYVQKNGGIDPEILDNPSIINYQMGLNLTF